jgi:hypothetical protein
MREQVKKYKGEVTKLKVKPTKTILTKNEKPATLKPTSTKSLDLLPPL